MAMSQSISYQRYIETNSANMSIGRNFSEMIADAVALLAPDVQKAMLEEMYAAYNQVDRALCAIDAANLFPSDFCAGSVKRRILSTRLFLFTEAQRKRLLPADPQVAIANLKTDCSDLFERDGDVFYRQTKRSHHTPCDVKFDFTRFKHRMDTILTFCASFS